MSEENTAPEGGANVDLSTDPVSTEIGSGNIESEVSDEAGLQQPIIKTGHIDDRRNFTHIRDMVEAYWLAIENCTPGKLYLIGSDKTEKIFSYREIVEKLIEKSSISNIKIEQDPKFVRPTTVPRLIGDTSKFYNATGWKPKIPIDKILEDTLQYWRDFVKHDYY